MPDRYPHPPVPVDARDRSQAEEPLLDDQGVSEYLGVPVRMARRLIYERRVPVAKIGKYSRVRRSDLDAWIEASTVPAVTR